MNFRLLLISIIPISVEKIELSAYTQKVSQQCSARYKRYGSCLKESNINASHPQQMPFCCEEGNKRASGGGGGGGARRGGGGGGGGGGASEEIAEERACMRVIVDRLRAVPLFLQLVR